jgi:hypothetical protein
LLNDNAFLYHPFSQSSNIAIQWQVLNEVLQRSLHADENFLGLWVSHSM